MRENKRKFTRFTPKGVAYAALGSKLNQIGRIINIGLGGLAFEFISEKEPSGLPGHVDIFTLDERVNLKAIPCDIAHQSASDLPVSLGKALEAFKYRRCGLRYAAMLEDKKRQLSDFLENQTQKEIGEKPEDTGIEPELPN
jgi:hypothetical protein